MGSRVRVRSDQWAVVLSDHLCECGCGELTMVAPRSVSGRGVRKGDPRRFVKGHQHLAPARVAWSEQRSAAVAEREAARQLVKVIYVPRRKPLERCLCGCGELAPRGRKVIDGHRRRGALRVPVRWVAEDRGFESLCWIWQLNLDHRGYGRVTVRGEKLKAHRVAYEDAVGQIPAGYEIHHRCEQKDCVNPAHLVPLTPEAHGQLHGEWWRRAA